MSAVDDSNSARPAAPICETVTTGVDAAAPKPGTLLLAGRTGAGVGVGVAIGVVGTV